MWDVEFTDEFGLWWDELDYKEQSCLDAYVIMLEQHICKKLQRRL